MEKTCPQCKRTLPIKNFHRDNQTKSGISCWCKKCKLEACNNRYRNNKTVRLNNSIITKKLRDKNRDLVFRHYGNKCSCCGESTKEFLTIDHINNDGANHRRENGLRGGGAVHRWLINHNFPEDFQILCFNCNCAKYIYKICPHKKKELKNV